MLNNINNSYLDRTVNRASGIVSPKANKRTRAQLELDLAVEAQMYIRGDTLASIAEFISNTRDYSLTMQQVQGDLLKIRQRWIDAYIEDYDAAKSKELARLDELEHAYWGEYQRLKLPIDSTTVEKTEDVSRAKSGNSKDKNVDSDGTIVTQSYTRTKVRKQTATPLLAHLEALKGVERCLEMRCRILGLNAPQKLDVSWRNAAKESGLDPDSIVDGIVKNIIDSVPPQSVFNQSQALLSSQLNVVSDSNDSNDTDYDQPD